MCEVHLTHCVWITFKQLNSSNMKKVVFHVVQIITVVQEQLGECYNFEEVDEAEDISTKAAGGGPGLMNLGDSWDVEGAIGTVWVDAV